MDFNRFKVAVATQFARMAPHPLFRVDVDKDALWDTYLSSFPPGTNPLLHQRTEHDCQGCKQFIRAVGDVIAIINGKIESLWDVDLSQTEPAYHAVAAAMSALTHSKPIANVFRHFERTTGTDKNFEQTVSGVQTWTHFFIHIPNAYVTPKADIPGVIAKPREGTVMLARALADITIDSVSTVLDLIAQKSIYRGEEHLFVVDSFQKLQKAFGKLNTEEERQIFLWTSVQAIPDSVVRIRSSVIGSLLMDLSDGRELDAAVASYEVKVAPTNYKRPTALITASMIVSAKEKVEELGFTSALERRYARLSDITINNLLYADRTTRRTLTGGVFDDLTSQVGVKVPSLDKVEEVGIERFLTEILPRVDSVEVMLENSHVGNLVSLITPIDPTAGQLFKWDNNFTWSYQGELADSIKERVKAAGGNVTGDLCCRLAWHNHDDLDLHMTEPNGTHIYYGAKCSDRTGGRLDVDMNVHALTNTPVENIFYPSRTRMTEGVYTLYVNEFTKRKTDDIGFEVEMDYLGAVTQFTHAKPLKPSENVVVAKFRYSQAKGVEILESLPSSQSVRTVWGLATQQFHRVNALLLSPNFWDDRSVGNKHFLFMLEGCVNDGTARPFFNEFLKESLTPHRKVFEVIGSKLKVADSCDQLSGLGFSSTQRNTLLCRVKGSFTRTVRLVF